MTNWIFYKLEYAVYLILGVWYLCQTPIFSSFRAPFQSLRALFLSLRALAKQSLGLLHREVYPDRSVETPHNNTEIATGLRPRNDKEIASVASLPRNDIERTPRNDIEKILRNDTFDTFPDNTRANLVRYGKILVLMAIAIKIIKAVVFSILQYFTFWEKLKPPFTPLSYSLGYNFTHFWFAPLIAILLAFSAFWFIRFINKKCGERFFWQEEYYFAAFGILAASGMRSNGWFWPILYFFAVFAIGLLAHFIKFIFLREKTNFRLSFYYIWLPLAICGIIAILAFSV